MMKTSLTSLLAAVTALAANAVELKLDCPSPNGWEIKQTKTVEANGVEEFTFKLTRATEAEPPKFSVSFQVPQLDANHKWTAQTEQVTIPPDWANATSSRLASSLPLVAFLNDTDENRILVASSEAKRSVLIHAGLREENCNIVWKLNFFSEPDAPLKEYTMKLRVDMRHIFFGDAIREGTAWIERAAGIKAAPAPELAFAPLYSAWYSFHQNVTDKEIEAECAEAVKLGMKVVIVDDGWQTDDNNRGYAFTGDWEISRNRFPNMAEHVKKVHAIGMKYMVWYGVPMMGFKAKNYERFKGKFLSEDARLKFAVMDPRFPEVRDYICGIYEKALREWDIDGFKLDFIDAFGGDGGRAARENYAGRDVKSISEGVDKLMREVYTRLNAIKPGLLIEFRQSYIGPYVRQYGNMMRAGDCPGDLMANRARTANIRLTSGKSATHADMLEWHRDETPENAARFVLSTMFSTIQYSVMLRTLPETHKQMITHWLKFSQEHRNALLKGWFRPHHYEAFYPWIEAGDSNETIIGVYQQGIVVPVKPIKPTYIMDGTATGKLVIDLAHDASVQMFDTFGKPAGTAQLTKGLNRLTLPKAGYAKLQQKN